MSQAPLSPGGKQGSAWWWPILITPLGLAMGCGVGTLLASALVGRSSLALACIGAILGATAGALQMVVLGPQGEQPRPDFTVWVVVSSIGGAISTFCFPLLFDPSTADAPARSTAALSNLEALLAGAGYGACVGLLLALCQWLLIRRYINQAWRWALAGAVGWMVGWAPLGVILGLIQR